MVSVNSNSAGRYSRVRGRPQSDAGRVVSTGPPAAATGGDVGARRDGAFGGIGRRK
jgi:hypothetical protein